VESLGTALTSTGGNESLGPPVGGIIFAQPVPVIRLIKMMQAIMRKYKAGNFFIIIRKHKRFTSFTFLRII
jgi:hypothetical protein